MKMVRTPCCEKMGLKKGPWTPEEDQILISYIQQFGHGNWRALPKQAGLSRCGKSCRLRWINYLRPDIKRGKFSKEEEETILRLHQIMGNRWSAIAARLPGRTDNEIKNFWHTHLKKRLERNEIHNVNTSSYPLQEAQVSANSGALKAMPQGGAEASNAASGVIGKALIANNASVSRTYSPVVETGFHRAISAEISGETMGSDSSTKMSEEMNFWYNLFMKAGQPSQGMGI